MGVDLSLRARLPRRLGFLPGDTGTWMRSAIAAARAYAGDLAWGEEFGHDREHGHWARLDLLCLGGDVRFDAPTPWRVVVSARTTPMGPGFHAFVCDLIRCVGNETGVRWEESGEEFDEAGFFTTGDWAALEGHFSGWVNGVAKFVLQDSLDGVGDQSICLPISPQFEGGPIRTHMGPREADYFVPLAAHRAHAPDFYIWPNKARDVEFHARMATALMWTEIPWRPPLDDAEKSLFAATLRHLAEAHRLDPARELPWREWEELAAHAGAAASVPAEVSRRATAVPAGTPLVGYRRRGVRFAIAGTIKLPLPGTFVCRPDPHSTFAATDGTRFVFIAAYGRTQGDKDMTPPRTMSDRMAKLPTTDLIDEQSHGGRVVGHWVPSTDSGSRHAATALFLRPEEFVLLTVKSPHETDRDWALNLWRAIEFTQAPEFQLRRS